MSTRKRKGSLGKDLDVLLSATAISSNPASTPQSDQKNSEEYAPANTGLRQIPLEKLRRGKYQPRRDFEQVALQELAESIKSQGVMQPIVVRTQSGGNWEIIAGERRWRASQLAGLDTIPALVREVGDDAAIAMALIENIQRKDLNPVEEAVALKRLQQEFQLSQQQVADRVGKSRSSIANAMRLLTLEPDVLTMVEQGLIDTGHGKVLLALEGRQQLKAARQVSQSSLSVRQTERLVKSLLQPDGGSGMTDDRVDPDVQRLERELSEKLGARVTLKTQGPGGGKLVITFSTNEELEGILTRFR
ncbi:MAG: ParB/RepB/Spo0J family partition protein [Halieaceae bacterium]